MAALNKQRIERDASSVLQGVAEVTGHDLAVVEQVVTAVRTVIDDLLGDGNVVWLDSLILSFGGSPTREALRERLASDAPVPDEVLHLDHTAVAQWLGLDFDTYAERPLANRPLVGMEVFDLLGKAAPSRPVVWDVLEAWDESLADGRPYRVSRVGLEAALENWLVENLHVLARHGLPIALAHRQLVLPNGKRPDLVCRFTEQNSYAAVGDWLVIELKAGRYYPEAADQVAGYVEQIAEHFAADGEAVLGLLVTDGADHAEVEDLTARGIGHISLAALGYRAALAQDTNPKTISSLSAPAPSVATEDLLERSLIAADAADLAGPATYRAHLVADVADPAPAGRARALDAAAEALWAKREDRRTRYEREWGDRHRWPAQHPTTVVDLRAAHGITAAVCIGCDWLTHEGEGSGELLDLHAEAKRHALSHTHDPALDVGQNPPKNSQGVPGLAGALAQGRANPRRAARRVARRTTD